MKSTPPILSSGRAGVLLIHGLTGTPSEMRFVARGLMAEGFETECVRLAGHCGSEADLLATGWRDWFASVEEAAEVLRQRVDHLFVAGLSMGAVLAIKYAIEHPEKTSGLGLYGATFFYDGWSVPRYWTSLTPLLAFFVRLGFGRNLVFMESEPYGVKNERLRRIIAGKMLAGDARAAGLPGNPWPSLEQFFRLSRDVQKNLHRVRAPALALHAREDDVASLKNVFLIQRSLGAPVETVILANSYHMITVDQEKTVVVARSADFFRRVLAREKAAESALS
ncbi:MAG: alpha/beta fold hydrolase [Zoogloeaceae bacterium]|jgi:carboxylesterase|nr:alpha/beta fold hydrolase [Zoogloeaceae bacterium]